MPNLKNPDVARKRSGRSRWRRALLMALVLPPCLLGAFALTMAYRIYASSRAWVEERGLPGMAAPRLPQSLLVFAPHCDDETLGAAGLMRQARAAGCDVHVVVITNGDGFRAGVSRQYDKLNVSPTDFVRYAYHRQRETRTALAVLGVSPDHISFLGYPDRGLMPMWTDHWSSQHPFRSAYTCADHCPYTNAPTPGAPYAGEALLRDIERQMQADRPTDIFVTHPSDDHPDHAAASVFVQEALACLQAQHVPWAQSARLHFYLVHRGDWPNPQGLDEDAPLPPPPAMAVLDTRWRTLPLSRRDIQKKYAAIRRYHSQTELTGRFLFSFARASELFGTLPSPRARLLPQVSDGRMAQAGRPGAPNPWMGLLPVVRDPVSDNIVRSFQSSADLTGLYACRDSRFLYVRLDAHTRLSPDVRYTLVLRPFVSGGSQPAVTALAIRPHGEGHAHRVPQLPDATYLWQGRHLTVSLPLARAGLDPNGTGQSLYLGAETHFAGLLVDSTGFRGVSCALPAASRLASR